MWWCLSMYCEEGICVLCSASFFLLMGKMWLVCFSSYQSCCVYPLSERKTSHYCVWCCFMGWCVTVIVVCSELRILLLCGSDLLESFCIPGLWNESDVRYNSFFLSLSQMSKYFIKCIILVHILYVHLN